MLEFSVIVIAVNGGVAAFWRDCGVLAGLKNPRLLAPKLLLLESALATAYPSSNAKPLPQG